MASAQLIAYFREQLAAGISKEDIAKVLYAQGWQSSDVDEAFAAVGNISTLSPAPPLSSVPGTLSSTEPNVVSNGSASVRRFPFTIAILCVSLLVGGGVAFAYFQQLGPFSVTLYSENSFLSSILSKSAQIVQASYNFSVSLAVDSRDKDATAFAVPIPDPSMKTRYENDAKTISIISYLINGLKSKYGEQQTYDYKTRKYIVTSPARPFPAHLSAADLQSGSYYLAGTNLTANQPFEYASTDGGKSFTMTTTLETSAAVHALKSSYGYVATTTIINGQKVIFTKDSGYIYIPSSAPQPFFVTIADSMRSIPPDVSGDVAIGATTDFRKDGLLDWRFNVTANGNFGDLSYKIDVEALKKDKDYYVRINKIPALFFSSFANYKGQWIKISPNAATSSSSMNSYSYNAFSSLATGISEMETSYKKSRSDATEALRNLALLADTENLIVFKTKPTRDSKDGRDLYRYQLDVRKEAIIPFYKDVLADPAKYKILGLTQDQGLLDYLQSKEFDDVFAYVRENTFLTLWTDKDGFPAVIEYRLRVIPPDTATQLKDKQVDLIFKLVFTDINKPVNIERPQDAKPIENIIDEVDNNVLGALGAARMKGNDAAIQSNLSGIQVQAEIYYGGGDNSYGTQAWVSDASTSCTGGMFSDTTITKALASADSANDSGGKVACYANGQKYIVGADLASGGWWCIDNSGASKNETGSIPTTLPKDKKCP